MSSDLRAATRSEATATERSRSLPLGLCVTPLGGLVLWEKAPFSRRHGALPSLVGMESRLTPAQIATTIRHGKGRMPGFPNLADDQMFALIGFLTTGESKEMASSEPPPPAMKYRFTGYRRFLDPEGYPAVVPPWGTLNAINLNTGAYVWKIPLGEYPELAAKGQKKTGTENYGGPIVTAGGPGKPISPRATSARSCHEKIPAC